MGKEASVQDKYHALIEKAEESIYIEVGVSEIFGIGQ